MSRRITPVILSGGSGTRLWPLSRRARPKQMLRLMGEETLLQTTAQRCPAGDLFAAPVIVGSAAHAEAIDRQLGDVGCQPQLLILEPAARNTAPAIALAALAALEKDEDAILLVMPSDHVITNATAFRTAVATALPAADEGWLVTFGIRPSTPETGYGYIRMGSGIGGDVHEVERFVEKPDATTAGAFLADGNYLWNAGIFLFRADSFLAAIANNASDIAIAVRKSMDAAGRRGRLLYPEPKSFAQSPSQSVDYAVMEKSPSVAVIPVDIGWSDIGSWDALHALSEQDTNGNALRGSVVARDSSNCLVHTNGPVVTLSGVSDLIVIATPDGVLVMPRGQSQDVKQIVETLQEQNPDVL